jgi:hypothetical protein
MQCSCGNSMVERTEVKNKEVVTRYMVCWYPRPGGESGGCGRVEVVWRKEDADGKD